MHNNNDDIIRQIIEHHVTYGHSKSSGHGGQNVNKRETKAELYFHIDNCEQLSDEQKHRIKSIYHERVSEEGVLKMSCQEERYLHANHEIVTKHFHRLLEAIIDGNEHHIFGRHDSKHYHKHHKHH